MTMFSILDVSNTDRFIGLPSYSAGSLLTVTVTVEVFSRYLSFPSNITTIV